MTDSTTVEGVLDRLGIAYKTVNSQSWSDRHGPSRSVYFHTDHGTIRISDHLGIPADLDLHYGLDEAEMELEIRHFAKLEISAYLTETAAQQSKERVQRERNAWLQTPGGQAYARELAKKESRDQQIIDDIETLGLGEITGRTRRQLVATLHSKSGRKALFTAYAEGRLLEVYPFS